MRMRDGIIIKRNCKREIIFLSQKCEIAKVLSSTHWHYSLWDVFFSNMLNFIPFLMFYSVEKNNLWAYNKHKDNPIKKREKKNMARD